MNKSKDHYAAWLNNYPFEVMITIRIPPNIPMDLARKEITQDVLGPLSRFLGNNLAVIGVIVPKTDTEQQHAHCLALSKDRELFLSSPEAQAYLRSLHNTDP